MRSYLLIALGVLACASLLGCGRSERPSGDPQKSIALPAPRARGSMSLEEALQQRRSVREFEERRLTLEELSKLAWAAQGVTSQKGLRTAPSAGACYPLELYVATRDSLYHYLPSAHRLDHLLDGDLRQVIYGACYEQKAILEAPAVFVLTAVYERTTEEYGARNAKLYVPLEAGHAAQNLLLQAVALGLGAVPIGGVDSSELLSALSLPSDETVLYVIPVGQPRSE